MKLLPFVLFLTISVSSSAQLEYKHLKNRWCQCIFSHDQTSDTLTFKREYTDDGCSNFREHEFHINQHEFVYTFEKRGVVQIESVYGTKSKVRYIPDSTYTKNTITDTIIDSLGQTVVTTTTVKIPNIISFGPDLSGATSESSFYVIKRRKNTLTIKDQRYEVILLTEETMILRKY